MSCKKCCDIKFKGENDYQYIIDRLKSVRNEIDKTIDLLEKRVEKDNIINEILATPDDNEIEKLLDKKPTTVSMDINDYVQIQALINRMNSPWYPYPYTYF